MVDLIVDTIGAIVVALMGYAYLKTGRYSFIADGVRSFVRKNPRLLRADAPDRGDAAPDARLEDSSPASTSAAGSRGDNRPR